MLSPAPTGPGHVQARCLSLSLKNGDGTAAEDSKFLPEGSLFAAAVFFAIAAMYWYLMVFASAAAGFGFPVPDFIPLTPGWPPSEADLAPAMEDSMHFFYLSDLLDASGAGDDGGLAVISRDTAQPTVRFAVFNLAEAWIFAMLPALLADKRRLPLPVLLATWFGALGLTNAFLTPYLAFRELFASDFFGGNVDKIGSASVRNPILSSAFGVISLSVVVFAAVSVFSASPEQWSNFLDLALTDRTYMAFCVDLVLFSIIQPFILRRATSGTSKVGTNGENEIPTVYKVPFIGLIAWLLGA